VKDGQTGGVCFWPPEKVGFEKWNTIALEPPPVNKVKKPKNVQRVFWTLLEKDLIPAFLAI
jgi:hypothetical protein